MEAPLFRITNSRKSYSEQLFAFKRAQMQQTVQLGLYKVSRGR